MKNGNVAGIAAILLIFLLGCKFGSSTPAATADGEIFNNMNTARVYNGPTSPTVFTINQPQTITYIMNYHYFNRGAMPGTIALRHSDGTVYGPWQATGKPGQGGVANALWEVAPNTGIKAGTYTVMDSDPGTWSRNQGSGEAGNTVIKGHPAN